MADEKGMDLKRGTKIKLKANNVNKGDTVQA